jgi:hypothetical protein
MGISVLTIKTSLFGETPILYQHFTGLSFFECQNLPHIKLPISKTPIPMRKMSFRSKYLYAFPHEAWKAAMVKKKADAYLEHV